jgi:hypothetical protein
VAPENLEPRKPTPTHVHPGQIRPFSFRRPHAAPDKALKIRKANLELGNIKNLAQYNPGLLKLGSKGAWPTVTLLGPIKSKLHPLEPELG